MTSKRILGRATFPACLLIVAAIGCNQSSEESRPVSSHQHGHHGGHTFAMSEDVNYQMEFTLDEKRRRLVIYVYDKGTQQPHSLDVKTLNAEFVADGHNSNVTFAAAPRSKDPQNTSSRFALSLDKLPQQLLASNQFELKFSFSDAGKNITGSMMHNNDHTHHYHHD